MRIRIRIVIKRHPPNASPPILPLQTIDTVVESLDRIIESALEESSELGYFPALYRRVTLEVKQAIGESKFDDGERMERLVVVFAGRYIEGYQSFEASKTCTQSWLVAFDNAKNPSLIVLQHLLLGMNAHISLDLGIAAAAVAKDDPLAIKADFIRINQILGDQIDDTQKRLTRMFGPLGLIDSLLGSIDEQLSLFSIRYARDKAWAQMLELALADERTKQAVIDERDRAVAAFASYLVRPPKFLIRLLLWLVRLLEKGSIPDRINILARRK